MSRITYVRQMLPNGTFGEEIPIGAAAKNIDYQDDKTLVDVIGDISKINIQTEGDLSSQISAIKDNITDMKSVYIKEIAEDDEAWEWYNNAWRYEIPASEHGKKKVTKVVVIKIKKDDYEETIDFSLKKYFTGKVAIILDVKINGKIIIRGE
jgi:hypothetical protein